MDDELIDSKKLVDKIAENSSKSKNFNGLNTNSGGVGSDASKTTDWRRRLTDGAALPVIPDCKNLGTILRVFIPCNIAVLVFFQLFSEIGQKELLLSTLARVNFTLTCIFFAFYNLRETVTGHSRRLQWIVAMGVAIFLELTACLGYWWIFGVRYHFSWILSHSLLTAFSTGMLLEYFSFRQKALQPSHAEGRLQALQARIRPHFLFNSLNTVLGLIRSSPKQAESLLESLSDLFRVFMRDTRELVALEDEVFLCQEYLAIEKLRLVDRLSVSWEIDDMPKDALLPCLLLQPLVENAVHHGIEPGEDLGKIRIAISRIGDRVRVEIENPLPSVVPVRPGNHMALSNIRERLNLTFDVEGQLEASVVDGQFRVLVHFPYRKERRRRDDRRTVHFDRR